MSINFCHTAMFSGHNDRIFLHNISDPREYAHTIRRNPALFLTESVLRWKGYIPHIMTFARGLPVCQPMLQLYDDSNFSEGMCEYRINVVHLPTTSK